MVRNVQGQIMKALKGGPVTTRPGDLPRALGLEGCNRQQFRAAQKELVDAGKLRVSSNVKTKRVTLTALKK